MSDHGRPCLNGFLGFVKICIRMTYREDDAPASELRDEVDHVAQLRRSSDLSYVIEIVLAIASLDIRPRLCLLKDDFVVDAISSR